ncbi:FtsX-like permease family protein [Carnobacterium mobile]|uniref:FtsX-like permease family protein n=1 Tax=Carnobacterium mobile TaxID=2750 RepID=UPI00054FF93A|nr:FtsX-like permease family protein [Carnobacterium mobile]
MNTKFFAKLAVRNIRSNKQTYLPYVLSSIMTVAMFFLMVSLLTNEFVQGRSSTLPMLFGFGAVVVGIFSFIFILYTNSFLIKRRKKEIGLYGILGLGKKHVAKVLLLEMVLTSFFSIVAGLITGQVFGKLFFMSLNYLLNLPEPMKYTASVDKALLTVALFAGIFLVGLLYNISQVTFSNPIKLLKGRKEGEKEPKGSIILFLLSVGLLAGGYWISLTIENPLDALQYFFIAVLLVIVGTYLFFISGSIFILKALKKNKNLYYRPGPFISISGMLYRMKQNAVGLANICILATMVIVALSTTVAMFVGTEETLDNRFPFENAVTIYGGEQEESAGNSQLPEMEQIKTTIDEQTAAADLKIDQLESYRYQTLLGMLEKNKFVIPESTSLTDFTSIVSVIILPLEDYNQWTDETIELGENEALYYHSKDTLKGQTLSLGEQTYQLQKMAVVPGDIESQGELLEILVLVLPNISEIETVTQDYMQQNPDTFIGGLSGTINWNTTGSPAEKAAYAADLKAVFNDTPSMSYESKEMNRDEWYGMNGGFLFLGVFLGLLFTIGTVLITYFKQVSEGYDDREKFQIMQKVGLDKKMIKDSTRLQIVWMFFLPIIIAVIHIAFAYPIIQKMLVIFGITNQKLLVLSILGVIVAFSLIYWLIYRITSRIYYNIVK